MLPLDADTMKVMIRPVVEKRQGIMKSIADPQPSVAAGDMPPEPVGFRWYLHSSLPVSWLAKDVIPAIRYLRRTERMPVVNVRRGWLHGTHLEVTAHSDDGRPVPWPHVVARLRPPAEWAASTETEDAYLARARELGRLEQNSGPYLPLHPHGTFRWIANSDLRPWPGHVQALRECVLTRMIDSIAATFESDEHASLGDNAPSETVAEIMLATADAHPLGIPYGTFSYRSHAEAFLNWSQSVYDPRPEFERRLGADKALLRPLVERMLGGADSPSSASWRRTASYCMGLLDSAVLAGSLTEETLHEINGRPGGVLPANMGPPGAPDAKPSPSEFHRITASAGINEHPPGWFLPYRLLLNLLYTQLRLAC